MHRLLLTLIMTLPLIANAQTPTDDSTQCAPWLNHTIQKLHSNQQFNLCTATANKTVLIVNTASHCGFTGQFSGLEKLHQAYKEEGLVIIGFPSNDFKQEAKSEEEAAKICFYNFGVSFLMSKPIGVTGEDAHPIFKHLAQKAGEPKWNFNKYLINKDGNVIDRFSSSVSPESKKLLSAVKKAL